MTRWRSRLLVTAIALAAGLAACGGHESATPPSTTAPAQTGTAADAKPSPGATPDPTVSAGPTGVVPERYKSAYAELDAALSTLEQTLPASPNFGAVGTVSTSLIMANSNSGAAILRPQVLDVIKAYLDDMVALGSRGVEIQVSYPVASEDYPNQAAYIAFYKQVVAEAHRRGMTVLIETSCIFANSPFSDVKFDFSKLTAETYFQARTAQIVTFAKEVRPDYLSFGEEPVNERVFAGIDYTPDQYVAFVNRAAEAVRAVVPAGDPVRIGVGTGTWEFDLFQKLVKQTNLDFYNIHLYPLQGSPGGFERVRQMASLAASAGKPVIMGESWLYKMAASEQGQVAGASAAEAFRRDAFDFWQPLDARFMRDVLALAAEYRMPFVSFWGARFMFGQLSWTPELDRLDFRGTSAQINPTLTANMVAGKTNALGDALRELLSH